MDVLFTDFKKAFDRVDQVILIEKLVRVGLNRRLVIWLWSYLHDRQLHVKMGSHRSSNFSTDSGVPQGSHIGPLLFVIFINDITLVIRIAFILMFADDVKLYKPIRGTSSSIEFQRDISALADWCRSNRLPLNTNKCKIMSFTRQRQPITAHYHIDGEDIERVTEFKDLGLNLDTKLDFKRHIEIICSKAYALLGFIKRICSNMNDPYALKSLYCSFVRSKLEYACVVWTPFYNVDVNRIESIQKQFILFALRKLGRDRSTFVLPSYTSRCRLINIETLQSRRTNANVFFIFDLMNGHIDAPSLRNMLRFNSNTATRSARTFHLRPASTNYEFNEPINRMCALFNRVGNISTQSNTSRDHFRAVIRNLPEGYSTS